MNRPYGRPRCYGWAFLYVGMNRGLFWNFRVIVGMIVCYLSTHVVLSSAFVACSTPPGDIYFRRPTKGT